MDDSTMDADFSSMMPQIAGQPWTATVVESIAATSFISLVGVSVMTLRLSQRLPQKA